MATLNFKGKPFVQNYHLSVKYHQLIPRKNKSLTKKVSLHDNLIIHGDNLKALGPYKKKRRLVFAPTKYLDQEHLDELGIDFAQLPFEIYQLVK